MRRRRVWPKRRRIRSSSSCRWRPTNGRGADRVHGLDEVGVAGRVRQAGVGVAGRGRGIDLARRAERRARPGGAEDHIVVDVVCRRVGGPRQAELRRAAGRGAEARRRGRHAARPAAVARAGGRVGVGRAAGEVLGGVAPDVEAGELEVERDADVGGRQLVAEDRVVEAREQGAGAVRADRGAEQAAVDGRQVVGVGPCQGRRLGADELDRAAGAVLDHAQGRAGRGVGARGGAGQRSRALARSTDRVWVASGLVPP
jgi:hypothetical protein